MVKEEHAAAAREQYQDEMIELEEREETDAHKALLEKEAAAREATYVEANVSGISELFERMMRDDPEYAKLKARPGSSFTLVPIRPRSRGERRSLRTFPVVTLHPRFPFNV